MYHFIDQRYDIKMNKKKMNVKICILQRRAIIIHVHMFEWTINLKQLLFLRFFFCDETRDCITLRIVDMILILR